MYFSVYFLRSQNKLRIYVYAYTLYAEGEGKRNLKETEHQPIVGVNLMTPRITKSWSLNLLCHPGALKILI